MIQDKALLLLGHLLPGRKAPQKAPTQLKTGRKQAQLQPFLSGEAAAKIYVGASIVVVLCVAPRCCVQVFSALLRRRHEARTCKTRQQLTRLVAEQAQLQRELKSSVEKAADRDRRLAEAERQRGAAASQLEVASGKIAVLETAKSESSNQARVERARVLDLQHQLEEGSSQQQELSAEMDIVIKQKEEAMAALQEARAEAEGLKALREADAQRVWGLEQALQEAQVGVKLIKEAESATDRAREAEAQVKALTAERRAAGAEVDALRARVAADARRLSKLEQQVQQANGAGAALNPRFW